MYASRATIDTGIENLSDQTLLAIPDVRTITLQAYQQGLTVNNAVGFQISKPLPQIKDVSSTFSGGFDLKEYLQSNYKTNLFLDTTFTENQFHKPITISTVIPSITPTEQQQVDYLPLQLSYNANWNNSLGPATFGLALSANLWFSSSTLHFAPSGNTNPPANTFGRNSIDGVTGSSRSTGHWVILRPSFTQNIVSLHNWTTSFRADGQWASEPLISNEQFGIGGINSVRGYHEGEIFGDNGWHFTLEEDTPPHIVGTVYDGQPLTVRGSAYMDAATAYLIDPQGRQESTKLWSGGLGFNAAVGSHWQAQFLFSLPLISTPLVTRFDPYFNFALTAQF